MAVAVRITVPAADREKYDALDDRVGQAMMEAGGPPTGLMSHVAHPEGDGFVLAQVWRTEAAFRDHFVGQLRALLSDLGLMPGEPDVVPVWSFAQP
jgi:hypothetical protein